VEDLGRLVKRGERALTLCMPITGKRREEDSDDEHAFTSFVYKARWFVLTQLGLEPVWSEVVASGRGSRRVSMAHCVSNDIHADLISNDTVLRGIA
jgi:hypothetical protein